MSTSAADSTRAFASYAPGSLSRDTRSRPAGPTHAHRLWQAHQAWASAACALEEVQGQAEALRSTQWLVGRNAYLRSAALGFYWIAHAGLCEMSLEAVVAQETHLPLQSLWMALELPCPDGSPTALHLALRVRHLQQLAALIEACQGLSTLSGRCNLADSRCDSNPAGSPWERIFAVRQNIATSSDVEHRAVFGFAVSHLLPYMSLKPHALLQFTYGAFKDLARKVIYYPRETRAFRPGRDSEPCAARHSVLGPAKPRPSGVSHPIRVAMGW